MVRPIVIIIGDICDDDYNSIIAALKYVIENDYKGEFIQYLEGVDSNLAEIKEKFASGRVILFIIFHDKYDKAGEMLTRDINSIRNNISKNIIIAVDTEIKSYANQIRPKNIVKFSHWDHVIGKTINKLTDDFYAQLKSFDVETPEERDLLKNQLLSNYQKSIDNNIGDFGRGDENQQLAAEIMRLRLSAPTTIKDQFDNQLTKRYPYLASFSPEDYSEALKKFQEMDNKAKKVFYRNLMLAQNLEPLEGGGFHVTKVGHGDKNGSFILHEQTMLFEISFGFAEHAVAQDRLRKKMAKIESIREGKHIEDTSICLQHTIEGLIIPKIDGHLIPFLILYENKGELTKKIFDFLISQRTFILIDNNGNLINK